MQRKIKVYDRETAAVVGETTPEELRAKILEKDPVRPPDFVKCPCGRWFHPERGAKGDALVFCGVGPCHGVWRCERCGTIPPRAAKVGALLDGFAEVPCAAAHCSGTVRREQEVCVGWDGPCSARIKRRFLTPFRIAERKGEPWRCRSCATRKWQAKLTPEQRSERTRKGRAAMTPEQRSAIAQKGCAAMTPEQRSERTRKGRATRKRRAASSGA